MTTDECEALLAAFFDTIIRVDTLHLSGGGEPFLHPRLVDLVEICMKYASKFDRLMLFTNCTVVPSDSLIDTLKRYKNKIIVQVSLYGVKPERESEVLTTLEAASIPLKVEKYYGDDQAFGGWVDFGKWEAHNKTEHELEHIYKNCAVTRDMCGNWRARDGKVHWCSRSQRGMELGLLPDITQDYVDLFDGSTREEKREKFRKILSARYLTACDYCSGDQGTSDLQKRHPAAEQL
jgi:hypothetical protein